LLLQYVPLVDSGLSFKCSTTWRKLQVVDECGIILKEI
jgi:hypothetical protein